MLAPCMLWGQRTHGAVVTSSACCWTLFADISSVCPSLCCCPSCADAVAWWTSSLSDAALVCISSLPPPELCS